MDRVLVDFRIADSGFNDAAAIRCGYPHAVRWIRRFMDR